MLSAICMGEGKDCHRQGEPDRDLRGQEQTPARAGGRGGAVLEPVNKWNSPHLCKSASPNPQNIPLQNFPFPKTRGCIAQQLCRFSRVLRAHSQR